MPTVLQSADPSNENWLGNLINWLIFQVIGGILMYVAWIFVLLGDPQFFYNFMIELKMLPSEVKSYDVVFDEE